ncbi:hypothetical protein KM043_004533 [Ampulex compressa]|nr:hypothetical protein KM043_004533 [Ampulex compressa]
MSSGVVSMGNACIQGQVRRGRWKNYFGAIPRGPRRCGFRLNSSRSGASRVAGPWHSAPPLEERGFRSSIAGLQMLAAGRIAALRGNNCRLADGRADRRGYYGWKYGAPASPSGVDDEAVPTERRARHPRAGARKGALSLAPLESAATLTRDPRPHVVHARVRSEARMDP